MLLYDVVFNSHTDFMESWTGLGTAVLGSPLTLPLLCQCCRETAASPGHWFWAGSGHSGTGGGEGEERSQSVSLLPLCLGLHLLYGFNSPRTGRPWFKLPLGGSTGGAKITKVLSSLSLCSQGMVKLPALAHGWITPLSAVWLIISITCITSSLCYIPSIKHI